MEEGINMGRKSPWSKELLIALYNTIDAYCKSALANVVLDPTQIDLGIITSYNLPKYPIAYIFIHYHFGKFEDLGMTNDDIMGYITGYLPMVKQNTQDVMMGMMPEDQSQEEQIPTLIKVFIDICKEVLYIEENY